MADSTPLVRVRPRTPGPKVIALTGFLAATPGAPARLVPWDARYPRPLSGDEAAKEGGQGCGPTGSKRHGSDPRGRSARSTSMVGTSSSDRRR